MKKILTCLTFCLAMAVSCTKTEFKGKESGMGGLNVDMNISDRTKAVITDDELLSSAIVNIYKADFSGLVRSYTYASMPSPFYLAADTYRVDVIAGEAAKETPVAATFENKSYKGSEEFTITAGNVTDVKVEAGVNNAVTNISFDQTVAENFNEGYTFTIGLDASDASTQLIYDASKSGVEGYFIVTGLDEPSFTWTFSGTLVKDGSEFTKSGVIKDVVPGKVYKMNLKYTIKDGDLAFSLLVDYTTDIMDDTIVFEPVSVGLSPHKKYEIWATHATVHADVDPTEYADAEVKFAYSTAGSEWISVLGINDNDGTYHAVLTDLLPSTEYSYKLVVDGEDVGEPMKFVTEDAPKIPNGSFEYASLVSGGSYYKFYDPSCGVEEGMTKFWGSGNGEGSEGVSGSGSMGVIITEISTDYVKDGKQSLLAKNGAFEALGMLTAGNIFTGDFANLIIGFQNGGIVNFGRPWHSRPTALRLWCKYSTGLIDILKNNNLGVTKNDYDRAQIKFAIGTWDYRKYGGTKDCPVAVNTTKESTFVDFYEDDSTIANGDLIIYNDGYSVNRAEKVSDATDDWIHYTIPLEYRDFEKYPSHIIISCSSSQFGDYFTGCSTAKLWIDAVELVY